MKRKVPDFGVVREIWEEPSGLKIELECKAIVPGTTLHELAVIYENAYNEADSDSSAKYSANPSKWPSNVALQAVVDKILEQIYGNTPSNSDADQL